MAFNEKLGRGTLGKSRKQVKQGAPEYFGSITFESPVNGGEKIWLAGWIKQNESGEKFFSIVAERPGEQQQRTAQRPPPQQSYGSSNNMDDDIPF